MKNIGRKRKRPTIRRDDTVIVTAGKEKGRTGRVITVDWKKERDSIQDKIKESQTIKKENKDNPAIVEEQENKIKRLRQFLNYNMIGNKNPIPRNDWVSPKKSKYANPKYNKIQSDPRLKRYYNFIMKSMEEGHSIIGPKRAYKNKWDKFSYLLPSVRKEVLDRGVEQGWFKTGKDLLAESTTIQETDDDFADTLDLIRTVGYGQSYSFKYSVRPGTPAAERKQVPEEIKNIRLQQLQQLLVQQQKTVQQDMVGRTVRVLFEKTGRQSGQVVGKSDYLHAVHVSGDESKVGRVENVLITKSNTNSLEGKIV